MSYCIRYVDMTTIKSDAIVNSLGLDTDEYGYICRSIVKSANSVELQDSISSWKNESVPGKLWITKGYDIPTKRIIHVTTSFYDQDPELFGLEYVYKKILMTAYQNKLYRLALPILGTGHNKYPEEIVVFMVLSLVEAFSSYFPEMEITVCIPKTKSKNAPQATVFEEVDKIIDELENLSPRDFKYTKIDFLNFDLNKNMVSLAPGANEPDQCDIAGPSIGKVYRSTRTREFEDELTYLLDAGIRPVKFDATSLYNKSITDYIMKYLEVRYFSEEQRKKVERYMKKVITGITNYGSFQAKHSKSDRRSTTKLSTLMKYAFSLHMSLEEAEDFLKFCGKAFSPVGKEDNAYFRMLQKQIYKPTYVNAACEKFNIPIIFDRGLLQDRELQTVIN